ncbi:hypothetical protein BT63DRAFT_196273 [Microthyrium microscopicum]|uniref:Uncharacterized protein n=1 Tax=Microthyrium microscopicum TaxID=703497 RepID=A0A6A6UNI9_9PEZI|nr:hypothetical protein BT63DRAFT_196273 [Microthyrium microscopicum]
MALIAMARCWKCQLFDRATLIIIFLFLVPVHHFSLSRPSLPQPITTLLWQHQRLLSSLIFSNKTPTPVSLATPATTTMAPNHQPPTTPVRTSHRSRSSSPAPNRQETTGSFSQRMPLADITALTAPFQVYEDPDCRQPNRTSRHRRQASGKENTPPEQSSKKRDITILNVGKPLANPFYDGTSSFSSTVSAGSTPTHSSSSRNASRHRTSLFKRYVSINSETTYEGDSDSETITSQDAAEDSSSTNANRSMPEPKKSGVDDDDDNEHVKDKYRKVAMDRKAAVGYIKGQTEIRRRRRNAERGAGVGEPWKEE